MSISIYAVSQHKGRNCIICCIVKSVDGRIIIATISIIISLDQGLLGTFEPIFYKAILSVGDRLSFITEFPH